MADSTTDNHACSSSDFATSVNRTDISLPFSSGSDNVVNGNQQDKKFYKKRKISFLADSVLCAVIQDGDMQELYNILHDPNGGVNVNSENHVGLTALHHAVLNNNIDAVKMLLCCGSEVNAQDVHGFSPLHTAAACGFLNISSLLILFGADVFLLTKQSDLAADLAKDFSVIRMLNHEMFFQINRESSKKRINFPEVLVQVWFAVTKCLRFVLTFLLALIQIVVSFILSRCQKLCGTCSVTEISVHDKNQNTDVLKDSQKGEKNDTKKQNAQFKNKKCRKKPIKLE